ncbi:tripartite motif-containing protein 16-like isoform X1 [Hemibagrus wyckioides]|uniref:tripartite motif-containing protein 16-like isoform X1 n=1 Tax=Hemibagrus wyckioides TaxID=337641 RepID=UPI00266B9DCB|nr:tripartite motif-containing protein 16-like isoform X1 [Hemibagrus wyckioides]XP_058269253.1 tripartite motif-containing protein 16-like isoform X1 [Hemibagrus wyckioides]
MAGAEKSYSEDQFSCSVCLDILKEPVTIPCGHSYCMRCVNNFWSALDQNAVHSCPQCRETFSPRPALKKNTLLAEVIEKMKNASDQASTSNQINLRCVKMECDFCIGTKNKADKFCLQCLASYCELHLQPHYESPAFAKHKLVPASAQMKKNICFHHGKLLDIYCCDDQQCICYLCMVESHNKHNTLSVESVRIKNQDSLERTKIKCQQMIAQRQEGLVEINRVKKSIMCFGQAAEEDSERIFTELIDSMRTRCSEVKELIRAQKQAELNRAEDLRQRLDRELEELRARMAEIEQLLASNDHIHFIKFILQKCNSVSALPRFKALPSTTCQLDESSKNISMAVLKEHLEDVCQQEVARIAREVMNIHALEPAEPKTRQDFLRYFCDLHLDPNTVHKNLHLSQGDKKVNRVLEAPPYPDHPERFEGFPYVLCKEGLYGRCYWEVDCSGNDWSIAMSYKGIMRKGLSEECRFGYNTLSWRLTVNQMRCSVRHNKIAMRVRQADSTIVGVYLDHSAGTLSFYSVSDQMILLHKVHTSFTEPVYAGFRPGPGSVIRILQANKE